MENQMGISNLAIVFGPTLFGISGGGAGTGAANGMADATWQNKACFYLLNIRTSQLTKQLQAIETILQHYADIFVDES